MPVLAADPHLNVALPSVWIEMHLICEPVGLNIAGAYSCLERWTTHTRAADRSRSPLFAGVCMPGLPGIIIGHTDRIAWGITLGFCDNSDVFVEEVNPENENEYRYDGEWRKFEVSHEVIVVKGAPNFEFVRRAAVVCPRSRPRAG